MHEAEEVDQKNTSEETESLSLWQVLGSTIFAALGVQKSKNRERDFQRGKPSQFIVAGILFTAAFVLVVALVVNTVLSSVQSG